jgi:cytochrome P450
VLSLLIDAHLDDGRALEDVEIRDEFFTLLVGSLESTAATVSWDVMHLARHPDYLARLVEELRAGENEFLAATIKETLRLQPVFSVAYRFLEEPTEIGGFPLPAGVTVAPSIYLLHRHPDLYYNPDAFCPQRFLDQQPAPHTWVPFGGGVRRCLGAAFSELEMQIILSLLLKSCIVHPVGRVPEPARRRGIIHTPSHEATVVLLESHL